MTQTALLNAIYDGPEISEAPLALVRHLVRNRPAKSQVARRLYAEAIVVPIR